MDKIHNFNDIYIQESVIEYIGDLYENTCDVISKDTLLYNEEIDDVYIKSLTKDDYKILEKYWEEIYSFLLKFPKENILDDKESIKPF